MGQLAEQPAEQPAEQQVPRKSSQPRILLDRGLASVLSRQGAVTQAPVEAATPPASDSPWNPGPGKPVLPSKPAQQEAPQLAAQAKDDCGLQRGQSLLIAGNLLDGLYGRKGNVQKAEQLAEQPEQQPERQSLLVAGHLLDGVYGRKAAVQKAEQLAEQPEHIFLQQSASIQPRTSPPTICNMLHNVTNFCKFCTFCSALGGHAAALASRSARGLAAHGSAPAARREQRHGAATRRKRQRRPARSFAFFLVQKHSTGGRALESLLHGCNTSQVQCLDSFLYPRVCFRDKAGEDLPTAVPVVVFLAAAYVFFLMAIGIYCMVSFRRAHI